MVRIFVSDVSKQLAAGEHRSELVRKLLAYAVKTVWDREMPEIVKDERGKPFFSGTGNMHFSLSHSKDHVLVALSECLVGADVETMRVLRKPSERLFPPEMLSDFGYLGGWCLREAVFKLRGEGQLRKMYIRRGPDGVVTPYEGICCRLYELDDCVLAAASWDDDFPEYPEKVSAESFMSQELEIAP